jgi:hypothetical protein
MLLKFLKKYKMTLEITTRRKYLLDKAIKGVIANEINEELFRDFDSVYCAEMSAEIDQCLFDTLVLIIRTIKGHENFIAAESMAKDLDKFETDKQLTNMEIAEMLRY